MMRLRKFYLIDKSTGKGFDLNQIRKAFLVNPSGLGFEYSTGYTRIGNRFVRNYKNDKQVAFEGKIVCASAHPYRDIGEFLNFIETMREPTIMYKTEAGTYYKDMDIIALEKTEIEGGALQCPITFMPLTLWYSENIEQILSDGMTGAEGKTYDYRYSYRYGSAQNRAILTNNDGSDDAGLTVEISGPVTNPYIRMVQNDGKINEVKFEVEVKRGEVLHYSSVNTMLYCYIDGSTQINLMDKLSVGSGKANFFGVPQGKAYVVIGSDSGIGNALVKVQRYYRTV